MTTDHVTFSCTSCGSKDFRIPSDPKPDDMITCAGCGASGRYADVQAEAIKQTKRAVEDMARDIFKKR